MSAIVPIVVAAQAHRAGLIDDRRVAASIGLTPFLIAATWFVIWWLRSDPPFWAPFRVSRVPLVASAPAAVPPQAVTGSLVWNVEPHQIRAQAVGRHVNKRAAAQKRAAYGPWAHALVYGGMAALGVWSILRGRPVFAAAIAISVLVTVLSVWALNLSLRRRITGIVQRNAITFGPHRLTAGPDGVHMATAKTLATDLRWADVRFAELCDDQIVLTSRSGLILVMPNEASGEGQRPEAAAATIEAWMEADREAGA